MAIQKSALINNPNGGSPSVSGNFWVTRGIYVSPDYSGVRATMALYFSQAAFLSGAAALYENDYALQNDQNPLGLGAIQGLVENQLIAVVPQFVSGTHI